MAIAKKTFKIVGIFLLLLAVIFMAGENPDFLKKGCCGCYSREQDGAVLAFGEFQFDADKEKMFLTVTSDGRIEEDLTACAATTGPDTRDAVTVTAADLVGPWHLAEGKYDESTVNETFPGAMEFGNSMEITGDGKISWYIGADGGTGTYTLDGNILLASMTNDFDGTAMNMELAAEKDGDRLLLTMDYKDLTLCWSWGE